MSHYTATMHRNEKKYCLNKKQYDLFLEAIRPHTQMDCYGEHTISNIYLDNDDYESIGKSMDKPLYKEKVRLRSYETPQAASLVYLEIKKKFSGVVYKRRVQLSLEKANGYLFSGMVPDIVDQTLREIVWVRESMALVPKVFIAYDRIAFHSLDETEVRLTLDANLRWRDDNVGLENGHHGYPCAEGVYVLEVKVGSAMPLWLSEILDAYKIYPQSFSKYSQCYQDLIQRKEDV